MNERDAKALSELIEEAKNLHYKQRRKHTYERYHSHLAGVAGLALQYYHLVSDQVSLAVYLAVAWWHDTVEDQDVTMERLVEASKYFSDPKDQQDFIDGVIALTDNEEGSREERKKLTIIRLSKAKPWVQFIKCADTEHNCDSLSVSDPTFYYGVMVHEKIELLKSFDPMVIKAIHILLIDLSLTAPCRKTSKECPVCNKGLLDERSRAVPYRDKKGLLRYIEDMAGNHCSHCAHFDITDYPLSQEKVSNVVKKGGSLLPSKL